MEIFSNSVSNRLQHAEIRYRGRALPGDDDGDHTSGCDEESTRFAGVLPLLPPWWHDPAAAYRLDPAGPGISLAQHFPFERSPAAPHLLAESRKYPASSATSVFFFPQPKKRVKRSLASHWVASRQSHVTKGEGGSGVCGWSRENRAWSGLHSDTSLSTLLPARVQPPILHSDRNTEPASRNCLPQGA